MARMTLQGLPTATELLGISFTTTLPPPITTLLPMVNSGHHLNARTDPHIIAHGNRIGIFQALISTLRINRVSCRVETAVGRDKYIIAKRHFSSVKNNRVVIGKEVLADLDIVTVIASKRGNNAKRAICPA